MESSTVIKSQEPCKPGYYLKDPEIVHPRSFCFWLKNKKEKIVRAKVELRELEDKRGKGGKRKRGDMQEDSLSPFKRTWGWLVLVSTFKTFSIFIFASLTDSFPSSPCSLHIQVFFLDYVDGPLILNHGPAAWYINRSAEPWSNTG